MRLRKVRNPGSNNVHSIHERSYGKWFHIVFKLRKYPVCSTYQSTIYIVHYNLLSDRMRCDTSICEKMGQTGVING